jgi:effector-binding domain-containing protein
MISMSQVIYQCEEKTLSTLKIAAVQMHAPYKDCGQAFARIGKAFWGRIRGAPFLLCYDTEYKEIANYQVCMPINSGESKDGIEVRDLPGGRCVSLVHKGPYDELCRSYDQARAYCAEKGYKLAIPSREVYLKGPGIIFKGNPKNYLTEIQLMIE